MKLTLFAVITDEANGDTLTCDVNKEAKTVTIVSNGPHVFEASNTLRDASTGELCRQFEVASVALIDGLTRKKGK